MHKGQPVSRQDAPQKVTGKARYTAEFHPPGMVYAAALVSTIPAGEVMGFEPVRLPGVLGMVTHLNAPKVPPPNPKGNRYLQPIQALQSARVHKYGQILGVVVATSWEVAREAAARTVVRYQAAPPVLEFSGVGMVPTKMMVDPDSSRGNFEPDFGASPVRVDQTYETPVEHHHPLEPHAVIAGWEGDKLNCYISSQGPFQNAQGLSSTFSIPLENVRVQTLFVGGGFGSKGPNWEYIAIAAMAARQVGKPVKFVLSRQQLVYNVALRGLNRQRVRIGASSEGKLTALAHQTSTFTGTSSEFVEPVGALARMLYAHPASLVTHRVEELNLPVPSFTRAPGETPGSFALECAMDELARALGMDPIELRLRNEPAVNPHDGKPWSSRKLQECLRQGSSEFGWRPGSRREGDWLVGQGMSASARGAPMRECQARVTVRKGKAVVELAATDIGTGSYTILQQVAADALGLPLSAVKVRIGDTAYPQAPASTGSCGAASFSTAVLAACAKPGTVVRIGPSEEREKYSLYGFGANFAEVAVDPLLGVVQVRRLHTVVAAGRILNPRLARSQILGGMVWGVGQALTEHSPWDRRHGNFLSRDLAHYHVPVNRDVDRMSCSFVEEDDRIANELGVKGLGELGMIGVAAAIVNAIFDATGKRLRTLPVRPASFMA